LGENDGIAPPRQIIGGGAVELESPAVPLFVSVTG
jgi:hypothetical protein